MREWILIALLLAFCCAAGAQQITNGRVTVRAVGKKGRYEGFDVLSRGKAVAVVRLSSGRLLTAAECARGKDGRTLAFTGMTPGPGTGLRLAKQDSITVTLKPNDPYPAVAFRLSIAAFDPAQWQKVAGKQPFHFLALFMDDAEVWHHRGWLNATPLADPFPLLLDTHVGSPEISAYHYNRAWSYTPPLAAHPIPVIGLWAPRAKHYAGFEFETTRLADNSERDVATGYHWVIGSLGRRVVGRTQSPNDLTTQRPTQFVALVYPYGGQGYQQLVFPKAGEKIASHGTLLWSDDMPSTGDPNRFFFGYLWERAKDRLPRVPAIVDMSWLPGGIRLPDFEGPPQGGLIGGVEGQFQVPGSKLIGGWRWQNEMPTQVAKARGDAARLRFYEEEAGRLLKYAKRFQAGGEECVFWEKPLEGEWTKEWGGKPVTTLHNANGFAAGRLFLSLYRDLGKTEYLPIIDGVFHWAKNVVWTRNEFADVPSSPFAIGGTLTASFCLDYYMTFKDAPDELHRSEARRALDLARSFTYRYMIMWPSDNNRYDNLDSTFLWEPNSGRDWTGAACSNEVFWNLDTLAQTAVHTGDPVLMWALQGALDRWHLLYQEKYKDSLADYQPSDMTEGYGLAPGNVYGIGARAQYGFASPLAMIEPVGNSVVRVLAGEKAAIVFNKGGAHTTIGDGQINDYRYRAPGNLAFTLHSTLHSSFDLSLTVPYVDISNKPVEVSNLGVTRVLEPGRDFIRPPQAPWSLYIKGLGDGDYVMVGEPVGTERFLPSLPPLTTETQATSAPLSALFEPVKLPYDTVLDTDWNHLDSWAGLPRGTLWAYGIPFTGFGGVVGHDIFPPYGVPFTIAPRAISKPIRFAQPVGRYAIALLYSAGEGPRPVLTFSDGTRVEVPANSEALAWRAWPPIYRAKLVVSQMPGPGRVTAIDPNGRLLFAVTVWKDDWGAPAYQASVAAQREGAKEWQQLQREEKAIAAMKQEMDGIPEGSVAILPPGAGGPVANLGLRAGLGKRAVTLTPNQLIDPDFFRAKRFPVALYADGEDYLHTVRAPGDAAGAVVRYVKEGGTLILTANQPFPMFYANGPGFHRAEPLTERLGIPLYNAIETMPQDKLAVEAQPGQEIVPGLPERSPYPPGDPRLRSIDRAKIPAGAKYTPIARIVGQGGKSYGDAAGLVDFGAGKGRILYVWDGLLRDPQNGPLIAQAALRFLLRAAKGE